MLQLLPSARIAYAVAAVGSPLPTATIRVPCRSTGELRLRLKLRPAFRLLANGRRPNCSQAQTSLISSAVSTQLIRDHVATLTGGFDFQRAVSYILSIDAQQNSPF